jgi:hypothetical protein
VRPRCRWRARDGRAAQRCQNPSRCLDHQFDLRLRRWAIKQIAACRLLPTEPEAVRDRGRLTTAGHAELGEDVGDVDAGGLGGDEQRLADLPVGPPPATRASTSPLAESGQGRPPEKAAPRATRPSRLVLRGGGGPAGLPDSDCADHSRGGLRGLPPLPGGGQASVQAALEQVGGRWDLLVRLCKGVPTSGRQS